MWRTKYLLKTIFTLLLIISISTLKAQILTKDTGIVKTKSNDGSSLKTSDAQFRDLLNQLDDGKITLRGFLAYLCLDNHNAPATVTDESNENKPATRNITLKQFMELIYFSKDYEITSVKATRILGDCITKWDIEYKKRGILKRLLRKDNN